MDCKNPQRKAKRTIKKMRIHFGNKILLRNRYLIWLDKTWYNSYDVIRKYELIARKNFAYKFFRIRKTNIVFLLSVGSNKWVSKVAIFG